ncbi:MAG: hypothetical protein AB7O66_04730 [Limisphaerales bacterium]
MKISWWIGFEWRRVLSPAGLGVLLLASALAGGGCGKSAEEESAEAPPAAETAPAEEVAETSAPEEESTTESALEPMNVDETLRGSDKAVAASDWGSATDALLKLQMSGSIKTDQQGWDYNNRMTVLQNKLIEAADNGDPKAQAAIERLKRTRPR